MKVKDQQQQQFHDHDQFVASPSPLSDQQASSSSWQSPSSFSSDSNPTFQTNKEDPRKGDKKNFGRKVHNYAYRIREHVRMGPKLSETVKGKLSLGAQIIHRGGRENIFSQVFGCTSDGERLLKASQCYLSTTAGPIAGILFVSTVKVAFCSERLIIIPLSYSSPSPSGENSVTAPYKVSIPTKKIKRASERENVSKPAEKYIEIVTEDNYEFWFMGFVRYEKAVMNLQKAISMASWS